MEKLCVLELRPEQLNDIVFKNEFIGRCNCEYIAFVDSGKYSKRELVKFIEQENVLSLGKVFAICAGEKQDAVQLPLEDVLKCFSLQIVGLIFSAELLTTTGKYNTKLKSMTDFEMLCRLVEHNGHGIFMFPGIVEDEWSVRTEDTWTLAYLMRRYISYLHACNKTEEIFQQMLFVTEQSEVVYEFKEVLNSFLERETCYNQIAISTAPFVVLRGDDTCHGVLRDFADNVAECLRNMGEACILAEAGKTDYDYLASHVCKAVIGIQSKAFALEYFKKIQGPQLQFWVDNPIFYRDNFEEMPDECYILCHDSKYMEYIKKQYHKENVCLLPPGGRRSEWNGTKDRIYDIVFVGRYEPVRDISPERFDKAYYEYMLMHPNKTFHEGLYDYWQEVGIDEEDGISDYLSKIKPTCQNIMNYYREKVIETILNAGYELHVYGETWKEYQSPNANKLIRHPEVSVEDSLREWQKAKVGLNVMSWHKDGMTERIANIMLSGAACLSDETSYLRKHFAEGEQIMCYSLDALEELPGKIRYLLEGGHWQSIASNGYNVAMSEHTWEIRTKQLVEMVEGIWNNDEEGCIIKK